MIACDRVIGESLCKDCGLCCDGTLFYDIELASHNEYSVLIQTSVKLVRKSGKSFLIQPCTAHFGECKIYSDRPRLCKEFECGLLKKVNSKTINIEEALSITQELKKLRIRIDRTLQMLNIDISKGSVERNFKFLYHNNNSSHLDRIKKQHPRLFLDIASFKAIRKKHFDTPKLK